MRNPHPWLARLARVGILLAFAALLALLGKTTLPHNGLPWYGERTATAWQTVATAGQAWEIGRDQVEDVASVLVGPGCWLMAAGLLRLVATGRLALAGPSHGLVRGGRWLAVVGMGLACVIGLLAVVRWIDPMPRMTEFRLDERLRLAVQDGRELRIDTERSQDDGSRSARIWRQRPGTPANPTRWLAYTLFSEVVTLFNAVRMVGLLYFLSAVVYCLGRPGPNDAEPT